MVLLTEKFNKLCSKLENHHNHHKEEDEEALRGFRFKVSELLNQLLLEPKPRSGNLSFSWIKRALELLPMIEKAFAKLAMAIDYPMSKWGDLAVEEYLNYSLDMLDSLNLMSSSISHLGHARLSMSYALKVKKIESLKPIELKIPTNNSRMGLRKPGLGGKNRFGSRKKTVIHQALAEVKRIGSWVCSVVLFGLSGDAKRVLEIEKSASGILGTFLKKLDLGVCDCGSIVVLKEVKEVNEAVNDESSVESEEELRRKLMELEKGLEELGQMVDLIFSRTLAGRTQLLDCIRTG